MIIIIIIVDFAVLADPSIKIKESEKLSEYLDLAIELKKIVEYESGSDTNCILCTCNDQ